jgi:hypothetical protein
MTVRCFVLEATDPATASVALDAIFEVVDVPELAAALDLEPAELEALGKGAYFELGPADVVRIRRHYGMRFDPGELAVSIRAWHPTDALPYKVHTNRELLLMLAGTKPMAAFVDDRPGEPQYEVVPERQFDPYVRSGRFVKREQIDASGRGEGRPCRHVLYATPQEAWRMEAYLLMWRTFEKSGWSEGFERMQGSLLGYEDWQNDVYIEMIYRPAVARRR